MVVNFILLFFFPKSPIDAKMGSYDFKKASLIDTDIEKLTQNKKESQLIRWQDNTK